MADSNGRNGSERLDRIEGIIEALANRQPLIEDEFARLLRAQVVTVDVVEKLTEKIDALAEVQKVTERKIQELADAQKHADQRMDALILTVDEIIRGREQ